MKKTYFILWVLLLFAANAMAQTDVTSIYLTNAGFDDSSSWQSGNMPSTENPNSAEVTGWKLTTSAGWSSSAAFGYGTTGQANGAEVPANGPDGNNSGGALGISTGWGGKICYEQQVELPAGKYRISYTAYNNNPSATQSFNFIGFITDGGDEHYGIINNFLYQTWMEDEIYLHLSEPTKGKICVGLGAVSEGSGNNAKVFIDHVKIEAYNAAESLMPGTSYRLKDWEGYQKLYNNTYPEYYMGNHYTGPVMKSVYEVENGTYSADIIFQAHKAWIDQVVSNGTLNAFIKANNITKPTEVINDNNFVAYEPKTYHFEDIEVTDGILSFEVGNLEEGANWLTVSTRSVCQMKTPYVSYGAFALPQTPVTPDFWYQVDVPIAGSYMLSVDGYATVYFTQEANRLVTDQMKTTTGEILDLAAGKLYLKASAAVVISLVPTSYAYHVGEAMTDAKFIQPGQTVTVSFNDASTNDPNAVLKLDFSGVTLSGKTLEVTETENGFSFVVPELMSQTTYSLSIPAGAVAYEGQEGNSVQTLSLTTIPIFDGTYFLRTYDHRYLARGNTWNTHAIVDEWGLPVVITTDGENNTSIQFADNGLYLYNIDGEAYTDWGTVEEKSTWHFIAKGKTILLESAQQEGRYVRIDKDGNLLTDGDSSNDGGCGWMVENPSNHHADMMQLREECAALEEETEGLTSKTYLKAEPTATAEQYQGTGEVMSGSFDITAPGIYRFSIQAFNRMASNDVAYPIHQQKADSPPVYAYFGDTKVQLCSVFEKPTEGSTDFAIDGNNYPNGQGGALVAFKEGLYQNVIYVRVTADQLGTWQYGIRNQGNPGNNQHWTCYATDGIEITRFYDPEADGLDPEDQEIADLIESLKILAGDVNSDGDLTVSDVMSMVGMLKYGNLTCELKRIDMNDDQSFTVTDVLYLVNVLAGRLERRYIDMTYTYAQLNALVAAEQSAEENAEGADYILTNATCTLTGEDVSTQYDIAEWLTTLQIDVPFSNTESVSVFAPDHTAIAGPMSLVRKGDEVSFTFPAGEASTYTSSAQSDVVTVRGNGLGTYLLYLLPQTLNNGLLVTVRTADGKCYSQQFDDITTMAVNKLSFTETQPTNLWMSTIPGNVFFSMLSTPGAHDACTSKVSVSAAKCQSEDLAGLLANGVRAFDLRPRYTSNSESDIMLDNLTIYHGMVSTDVKFKDAIDVLIDFVKNNPSEAVSVIMQKENSSSLFSLTDYSETWRASIRECFSDESRSAYIMPSVRGIHTLDDVRGKVSIVSKNPYGNSDNGYRDVVYGAIIENWPDDDIVDNFSCGMTQALNWTDCWASVEDAYNSSTSDKESQVSTSLSLASSNTDHFRFVYTFLNIANSPASYAATLNPYTVGIIANLNGSLGYVYADYMGSTSNGGNALLQAVIKQNNKYVFNGRSRINNKE